MKDTSKHLEAELTVIFKFDSRGITEASARCGLNLESLQQCIEEARQSFLQAMSGKRWSDDSTSMLSIDLHCFTLNNDEQMLSTTLELGVCKCLDSNDSRRLGEICDQMVNCLRPSFLHTLQAQGVVLS